MNYKNVLSIFDDNARAYPGQIAISDNGSHYTYADLNYKSKTLANYLEKSNGQDQELCFVFVNDAVLAIMAMTGIMRAGRIYVPINPNYPNNRIEDLINDYKPKWLVIDEGTSKRYENIKEHITEKLPEQILMDRENMFVGFEKHVFELEGEYSSAELDSSLPSYIFFTSGSTGKPKGILGNLKGVDQYINWEISILDLPKYPRVTQFSTPSFDAFLRDVFLPLSCAGTICIPPSTKHILDISSVAKWIDEEQINLIHCVPSLFNEILRESVYDNEFSDLKYVLLSGEPLLASDLKKWCKRHGSHTQFINLYGPSETTMTKLYYKVGNVENHEDEIPIGKPITDCKAILLDEDLNPTPKNSVGELYIRTPYMSLGYYNEHELTKDVFIEHPKLPNELLYKTGDLAFINSQGDYVFKGRKDSQVKINGIRVELNEISSALKKYEKVKDAVTFKLSDGLGVCVLTTEEVDVKILKEYLLVELPKYIIPNHFLLRNKFPKNTNGKLDRIALLAELKELAISNEIHMLPKNNIEEKLLQIFSQTLKIPTEKISVTKSFFQLGGHSLHIMSLINSIFKELDVRLKINEVFLNPDIQKLALLIQTSNKKNRFTPIPIAAKKTFYPLSPAQKRMLFFNQMDKDSTTYNMTRVVNVNGLIDVNKFQECFQKLLDYHEILRTSFILEDGEPVQRIHESREFFVESFSCSKGEEEQLLNQFIRPFNLELDTLIRFGVISTSLEEHLLVFDTHHIISDEISMGIIVNQFSKLYKGEALPEVSIQYKDYTEWQLNEVQSEVLLEQKEFWNKTYKSMPICLDLPWYNKSTKVINDQAGHLNFQIDKDTYTKLKKIAEKENATTFMIFLSALVILLKKIANSNDIVVGVPTSGRSHPDLDGVLGMFTNTLPMRYEINGDSSYANFLYELKLNILKYFENQDYQYQNIIEDLNVERDVSRNALFDVMFDYVNFEERSLEFPDLTLKESELETNLFTAKFDLNLSVTETDKNIFLAFTYSKGIFDTCIINSLKEYYLNILNEIANHPNTALKGINILSTKEQDLLTSFNDNNEYNEEVTVLDLFEEQFNANPQKIAVSKGAEHISYKEIAELSDNLAKYLLQKGLGKGNIVPIYIDKSPLAIVYMLGALKTGAAFVPINITMPKERLKEIFEELEAKWILSTTLLKHELPENYENSVIDERFEDNYHINGSTKKLPDVDINDLAYVIYTSGTTGRPKGVKINHGALCEKAFIWKELYGLSSDIRLLQMANFSFDVFIGDFCRSLLYGGQMILSEIEDLIPEKLSELIVENKVNILEFTPGVLVPFLNYTYANNIDISSLKTVIIGSDTFHLKDALKLLQNYGDQIKIYNSYGVTEATIVDLVHLLVD